MILTLLQLSASVGEAHGSPQKLSHAKIQHLHQIVTNMEFGTRVPADAKADLLSIVQKIEEQRNKVYLTGFINGANVSHNATNFPANKTALIQLLAKEAMNAPTIKPLNTPKELLTLIEYVNNIEPNYTPNSEYNNLILQCLIGNELFGVFETFLNQGQYSYIEEQGGHSRAVEASPKVKNLIKKAVKQNGLSSQFMTPEPANFDDTLTKDSLASLYCRVEFITLQNHLTECEKKFIVHLLNNDEVLTHFLNTGIYTWIDGQNQQINGDPQYAIDEIISGIKSQEANLLTPKTSHTEPAAPQQPATPDPVAQPASQAVTEVPEPQATPARHEAPPAAPQQPVTPDPVAPPTAKQTDPAPIQPPAQAPKAIDPLPQTRKVDIEQIKTSRFNTKESVQALILRVKAITPDNKLDEESNAFILSLIKNNLDQELISVLLSKGEIKNETQGDVSNFHKEGIENILKVYIIDAFEQKTAPAASQEVAQVDLKKAAAALAQLTNTSASVKHLTKHFNDADAAAAADTPEAQEAAARAEEARRKAIADQLAAMEEQEAKRKADEDAVAEREAERAKQAIEKAARKAIDEAIAARKAEQKRQEEAKQELAKQEEARLIAERKVRAQIGILREQSIEQDRLEQLIKDLHSQIEKSKVKRANDLNKLSNQELQPKADESKVEGEEEHNLIALLNEQPEKMRKRAPSQQSDQSDDNNEYNLHAHPIKTKVKTNFVKYLDAEKCIWNSDHDSSDDDADSTTAPAQSIRPEELYELRETWFSKARERDDINKQNIHRATKDAARDYKAPVASSNTGDIKTVTPEKTSFELSVLGYKLDEMKREDAESDNTPQSSEPSKLSLLKDEQDALKEIKTLNEAEAATNAARVLEKIKLTERLKELSGLELEDDLSFLYTFADDNEGKMKTGYEWVKSFTDSAKKINAVVDGSATPRSDGDRNEPKDISDVEGSATHRSDDDRDDPKDISDKLSRDVIEWVNANEQFNNETVWIKMGLIDCVTDLLERVNVYGNYNRPYEFALEVARINFSNEKIIENGESLTIKGNAKATKDLTTFLSTLKAEGLDIHSWVYGNGNSSLYKDLLEPIATAINNNDFKALNQALVAMLDSSAPVDCAVFSYFLSTYKHQINEQTTSRGSF